MPNINLKTVLKLYSPIWCIKEVKQGEEVGYGNKKQFQKMDTSIQYLSDMLMA